MNDNSFTELLKQDFQRFINPNINREEALHIFESTAPSFKKKIKDKTYDDVSVEKENEIYEKMKKLAQLFIRLPEDAFAIQFFQDYYDIMRMRKLRQGNTLKNSGAQVSDDDSSVVSYDSDEDGGEAEVPIVSDEEIKELFLEEWGQAMRQKSQTYTNRHPETMIIHTQTACLFFNDTNEQFLNTGFELSACLHKILSLAYNQDPATNELFAGRAKVILTMDTQDLQDAYTRIQRMAVDISYETTYIWAAVKTYLNYCYQQCHRYMRNEYDTEEAMIKRGHRDFSDKSVEEVKNHIAELKAQLDEKQTKLNYYDIANGLISIIDAFQRLYSIFGARRNPFEFEDPFFGRLDPLPRFDMLKDPFKIEELVEEVKAKMSQLDMNDLSLADLRDISKCLLTLELDWSKYNVFSGTIGEFEQEVIGIVADEDDSWGKLSMKQAWKKMIDCLEEGYANDVVIYEPLLYAAAYYQMILQPIAMYQECQDPFYGLLTEPDGKLVQIPLPELVKRVIDSKTWDFKLLNTLIYKIRDFYYEESAKSEKIAFVPPAKPTIIEREFRPALTDSMFNSYLEQKAREFYNSKEEAMSDLKNQADRLIHEDYMKIGDEDAALHLATIWYWMNDCPNHQNMDKILGLFMSFVMTVNSIQFTKQLMNKTAVAVVNNKRPDLLESNMLNLARCFKIIYGTCYWYPKYSPEFTKAHAL